MTTVLLDRPSEIASTTQHIAARDLMTPDEIMQIDPSVQLLRVQGKPVRQPTHPELPSEGAIAES